MKLLTGVRIADVLGILGFVLGLINLAIKLVEMKKQRPRLRIIPKHPPSDEMRAIYNGDFFIDKFLVDEDTGAMYLNPDWKVNNAELYFGFVFTNSGGQALQIINLEVLQRDRKRNVFYHISLPFSADYEQRDIGGEKYTRYNAHKEIIDVPSHSSIEKHFVVKVDTGSYRMHHPRRFDKGVQYLVLQTSNGKMYKHKLY